MKVYLTAWEYWLTKHEVLQKEGFKEHDLIKNFFSLEKSTEYSTNKVVVIL